ncbi:MAG: cytochrome P460 family protein [Planctomycetaceae bacterium]
MLFPSLASMSTATVPVLAILVLFFQDGVTENEHGPAINQMQKPSYDDEGRLLRPFGYEKWVVVGTSIGLGYSDGDKADPTNPGTFHNVYLQPEAFDHYVQTGEFPEQTVFLVTNNKSRPANTKGAVSRKGFVASPTSGVEVAIKDTKRFPDGWAYFMFHDSPEKPKPEAIHAERAFDRKDCYDCHAEHGAHDNVFTQYYSVLTEARQQHLDANKANQ